MARKKLVRLNDMQKKQIQSMYLDYYEWPDVADKFDISKGTYHNIIRPLIQMRKKLHIEQMITRLNALPPQQLGWIAGIIDGEGHIGMYSRYRKRDNTYWMGTKVEVGSTTPIMQTTLHKLIGAGNIRDRPRDNPKWKDVQEFYMWRVETVFAFLTVLKPFLVVKKRQAETVLKWALRRLSGKPYIKADMGCFKRIRTLNARGKPKIATTL